MDLKEAFLIVMDLAQENALDWDNPPDGLEDEAKKEEAAFEMVGKFLAGHGITGF